MDVDTKAWIKQVLANSEVASDKELLEYFVKECGLSHDEAVKWLALRAQYRREVLCDAEPDELTDQEKPYELPAFMGYTADMRLGEFRKAIMGEKIEFISFDSPEGKKLFQELKSFAQKVILF